MARKCKCKICRTEGTTDTFYKVTNEKGKNSYFCSEEEYKQSLEEKVKYKELMCFISEQILGYKEGQIVPPVLVKKIMQLKQFYNYEVILKAFELKKDDIHYWIIVKNFNSEYGKVSYIMKIIEGCINDVHDEWVRKKSQHHQQEKHDINSLMNEDIIIKNRNIKNDNSILDFLEEDDL
ncbi:hypothetical protein V1503_19395 [Bacillus sp. SCS-151]|uniref:hypothetical protein n=1 Tax=Nanhaiella sioensis TaxID=3115293 RepID=UPI00397B2747